MHKTISTKDGRNGMGYDFFLTKVLSHFEIPLGLGVTRTIWKNYFYHLVKCECVEWNIGTNRKVFGFFVEQEKSNNELDEMTVTLTIRDAKISHLKAELLNAKIDWQGGDELSS